MQQYEYLLAIKDYCEGDLKETILEVNDLIQQIQDNPNKFIEKLSDELEEYCSNKDICPFCGEELTVVEQYEEDRGDYWGQPAKEQINIVGCSDSNCSYIKK